MISSLLLVVRILLEVNSHLCIVYDNSVGREDQKDENIYNFAVQSKREWPKDVAVEDSSGGIVVWLPKVCESDIWLQILFHRFANLLSFFELGFDVAGQYYIP